MPTLKLHFLASPLIEYNQQLVHFDRRKSIALLAYLALHEGPQSRDGVATLLWPEMAQAAARGALRGIVFEIRGALGEEWLVGDRQSIALARGPEVWVDLWEFQRGVAENSGIDGSELNALAAAVKLYRADFLAGFTLNDSVNFDEWQLFQSEELRRQYGAALVRLVDHYTNRHEFVEALAYAQAWVALDRLNETAQRTLIELYARCGQRAAALRQYQNYAKELEAELGESPTTEMQSLAERIRTTRASAPKPMVVRSALRHNLPNQPTLFIGRERELAQIAELMSAPHCRLLTLVGPGGIGKTRLALQAAVSQSENFEHGVHFLALAPLESVHQMAIAALDLFHIAQQAQMTPQEQLLHYLSQKRLLLILDNMEHLREGVALVKEILNAAPDVKLLVTSRERLKLQEERLFPVEGMELPPNGIEGKRATQPAEVARYSAIRLFEECARRVQPHFTIDSNNAAAILRICRLVAAMPLAIELSAAWTRLLSCADIAEEISRSIDFLASSWQDSSPRHQSMNAVFEHSWQMLATQEQESLCQLTVFRGGFRPAAAQAVAGSSLSLLADLVDKSWLKTTENSRFDMHELVRQFVMSKQGQVSFDSEGMHARHSIYYGTLLYEREALLFGDRQLEVFHELLADVDNIRLGWRWAIDHLQIESIGNYLKSWQWLGEVRGWHHEMEQLFGEAADKIKSLLARMADQANAIDNGLTVSEIRGILARTLHSQARHVSVLYEFLSPVQAQSLCEECLAIWSEAAFDARYRDERAHIKLLLSEIVYDQGRYDECEAICLEAWRECQAEGDQSGLQYALFELGLVEHTRGEYPKAIEYFSQSVATSNAVGEQVQKIKAMMCLSEILCNQDELVTAQQIILETRQIAETFSFTIGITASNAYLGYIAFVSGQLDEARDYFQNNLTLCNEMGNNFGRINCRRWLGNIAYRQHDYATARHFFAESLALAEHRPTFVSLALTGLGNVACGLGDYNGARQFFCQALDTLQMSIPIPIPDLLQTLAGVGELWIEEGEVERAVQLLAYTYEHPAILRYTYNRVVELVAAIQGKLSKACSSAALSAGKAMTLEQAIAFAREATLVG